ncbi:MAG: hypothetical protein V4527_08230 [Pseudomonadota bacterium]
MAADRIVRFLCSLDGASTSRVLNLRHIARINAGDPEHGAKPLFLSPVINTAFVLKHRIRSDESYLFTTARSAGTKIIVPVDPSDLRAGGRSIFVDQRGFIESLRDTGHYADEKLDRDISVLHLLSAIPSLDPFLLREHLRNNGIDVAPCYFAISANDQDRMHQFVSGELSRLVQLANGSENDNGSTGRMVTAMLSGQVNEKLEPLRMTLGLSGSDFREGAFGWRGFLYYKWAMQSFWPDVMGILREIKEIIPQGAISETQRTMLVAAKRNIIELVRDNNLHVSKVLAIYDESFAGLIASNAPKTFRDFLLSAPYMFLELGEKMGAISHIVSFWRYRFPKGRPVIVDAEEMSVIFQDFTSGFAERTRQQASPLQRPQVIQA